MNKAEKIERLLSTVEDDKSSWLDKARVRRKNREWQRKSKYVAIKVLRTLAARNMQQTELADLLDVKPQQVSKILSGKQNFTLKTISQLEQVLGISLLEMPKHQAKITVDTPKTHIANYNKEKGQRFSKRENLSEMEQQDWNSSKEPTRKAMGI